MQKKITLIQPPFYKESMNEEIVPSAYFNVLDRQISKIVEENQIGNDVSEFSFIEANIGLLYIAGELHRHNYEIEYVDCSVIDLDIRKKKNRPITMEDIEENLKKIPIDMLQIVGISHMTVNFGWARKIASLIKKINPQSVVILGGVHASFEFDAILENNPSVDFVSIGEGEKTIVELADTYYESCKDKLRKENFDGVKGIAYRNDENKVIVTHPRGFIEDLDSIAYPYYEIYPKEVRNKIMIRVITSRGCSNNCSFCVPSRVFNKLRFRRVECVVDEIEHYYKTYGWRLFMIGDLNFLSVYEYAQQFCNEIIRRKLDIHWICQSRVDLINEEITVLMRKAGCIMICLGIESADQDILDNSNKMSTTDRCIKACRQVKQAGIRLFTYWVFGLPGETHDSAHATIKLLRYFVDEKLVDMTHCTVCVPYPGTDLYKHPDKYKIHILHEKYEEYWMNCDYMGTGLSVIETEGLSKYEIYAYWQMALAVVAGNLK